MSDDDENEEGGVGWWKWLWIIGIALLLATAVVWGLGRWNRPAPPPEPAAQEQVAPAPPPVNPTNAIAESWAVTCTTATEKYNAAAEAEDITSCYAKLEEGDEFLREDGTVRMPDAGRWEEADAGPKKKADDALGALGTTKIKARAVFETLVKKKIKGAINTLKPLTDAPGLDRLLLQSLDKQETEEKKEPSELYSPDTVKGWITADVGRFFFKAAGIPDKVISELVYDVSADEADTETAGEELSLKAYSLRFSSWLFKSLRMRWAQHPDELWAFYQAHKNRALSVIQSPGVNAYLCRKALAEFRVGLEEANKPAIMSAWKSWKNLEALAEAESNTSKKEKLKERAETAGTAWDELAQDGKANHTNPLAFGFRRRLEGGEVYVTTLIKICDDMIASIDAM